jgi:NAD-dependent deacetylase
VRVDNHLLTNFLIKYRLIDDIRDKLNNVDKIVFLTGAGISQESGISTFRDDDGLWQTHDPSKLASPQAFIDNPRLVWKWYNDRRMKILAAKPNPGHIAIANLQYRRHVSVITQNIDGLHQLAGSKEVAELHGNIFITKCTRCNFRGKIKDESFELPVCGICGSLLRPNVVWFGETINVEAWNLALECCKTCDAMIIVGTSSEVYPANTLYSYAKKNMAKLIEINPKNSRLSKDMDFTIRSTAAVALPMLLSIFSK